MPIERQSAVFSGHPLIPLTHQRDPWPITFSDRTTGQDNISFALTCGAEEQRRRARPDSRPAGNRSSRPYLMMAVSPPPAEGPVICSARTSAGTGLPRKQAALRTQTLMTHAYRAAGCCWRASAEVLVSRPDGLPGPGELLADPDGGALFVVVDADVVVQVCGEAG
jgi:hypothetical protein